MDAQLIFKDKYVYSDGAIREMIIWRLPEIDNDRPHGLKYRLYYGYPDESLLRYDNERGKGDHKHVADKEEPYIFYSVEQLIMDFKTGIDSLRG